MSMERRITTLEEVSQLLIAASRGLNQSVERLEALAEASERRREASERQQAEYQRQHEEEMRELAAAVRRSDEAVQALLAFVPVTQAEIVRLDSRIDRIEGS